MKRFLMSAFALLVLSLTAFKANAELECKTLNPTTNQPQTVFSAGDDVLLTLNLNVPEEVVNKPVDIKVSASVEIKSLGISFSIPNIKLKSPYKDPRENVESLPFTGRIVKEKILTIPEEVPPSKIKLTAFVATKGVGSAKCVNNIEIK